MQYIGLNWFDLKNIKLGKISKCPSHLLFILATFNYIILCKNIVSNLLFFFPQGKIYPLLWLLIDAFAFSV